MISSHAAQMQARDIYTDLSGLQRISQQGRENQDQALRALSKQFESLFMQMLLQTMRSANEVFEQADPLNSFAVKMHRDMLDHQTALQVSKGAGTGLADVFYRQLQAQYHNGDKRDVDKRTLDNKSLQTRVLNKRSSGTDNADAVARTAAIGARGAVADSPQAFVAMVAPYAQAAADVLGVDAKVLIAQSALETGWGRYVIEDAAGNNAFNLFNIKADKQWQGGSVRIPTVEYKNGLAQRQNAVFRSYSNVGESFADYVNLLQSAQRYQPALDSVADSENFIRQLQHAGYATDPNYADKVLTILASDFLE
jgi:peptidoglycan hydrolase FlgJ